MDVKALVKSLTEYYGLTEQNIKVYQNIYEMLLHIVVTCL